MAAKKKKKSVAKKTTATVLKTSKTAPKAAAGEAQSNGKRRTIDVSADSAEFVTEIPKVQRKKSGPRGSKWDAVVADLVENPKNEDGSVRIRLFRDVSVSTAGSLTKTYKKAHPNLKARNRNVSEDGKRADLYLSVEG